MSDTVTMLREERDKWVEALRSGKYQQCRDSWGLGTAEKDPDEYDESAGFCCLNVLGHVLTGQTVYSVEDDSIITVIENAVGRKMSPFIQMNDVQRLTFAEIADWIENNVGVKDA